MATARTPGSDTAYDTGRGDLAESDEASRPFLPAQNASEHGAVATLSRNEASVPVAPGGAELTMLNALAIIIGLQIGSGIFLAPAQISNLVPSPGFGVLVWLFAGLFVWTGAASFAELGLAIPINGGVQEYLRFCYGDFVAFVFTSTYVLLTKPAAMAMIAIVFSDYVCRAIFPGVAIPVWLGKIVALSGLIGITVLNCTGVKTGPKIANAFLVLKLGAICSICLIGLVTILKGEAVAMNEPSFRWFHGGTTSSTTRGQMQGAQAWASLGDYVTAFYAALFCFGGWESIGFVAGEMRNTAKHLPYAIHFAMTVVIVGFVITNIAFYAILPIQVIREKEAVAAEFGKAISGHAVGLLYCLIVSVSALGALNINVFATGRLCVAASKRGYFPAILANLHYDHDTEEHDYYHHWLRGFPATIIESISTFAAWTADLRMKKGVPIYAMTMNALISCVYTTLGTFDSLTTFVGISEYIFFLLAVYGLRRVRKSHHIESKTTVYKTWTFNPIIFCIAGATLVVRGIFQHPWQGAFIILIIVLEWIPFRYFDLRFRGDDIAVI